MYCISLTMVKLKDFLKSKPIGLRYDHFFLIEENIISFCVYKVQVTCKIKIFIGKEG